MSVALTDRDKVIDFKLEWLRVAGYSERNALKIARDETVDWHVAVNIRKRCQDEKLCMKVLLGR